MAIKDYSTTAGSNTSISGISIAEGCPPGNINDAQRQLMADLAAPDFGASRAPKMDAIAESTAAAGVTVDGLLIKDGGLPGLDIGDVFGPASSTDGNFALFDGTDGKLLKDGGTAASLRTLLGLGNSAVKNTGVSGGVALYDDPRFGAEDYQELSAFASIMAAITAERASASVPGGYLWTFRTDELATKTNATYDAVNNRYANAGTLSGTAYALTSGMLTLAGFNSPSTTVLVDGLTTGANNAPTNGTPAGSVYCRIHPTTAQDFGKFRFYLSASSSCPALKAQYSDDGGSSWSDAGGSISSFTTGWNEITSPSVGPHADWQLVSTVTAPGSGYWTELETYAYGATTNMTLIPAAVTAAAAPDTATLFIVHKAVDATTLNTDIKARATRDNGSNWSGYVTLATVSTYDATYSLLKGAADLSALASGTSVKWEITTLNSKGQYVACVLALFG